MAGCREDFEQQGPDRSHLQAIRRRPLQARALAQGPAGGCGGNSPEQREQAVGRIRGVLPQQHTGVLAQRKQRGGDATMKERQPKASINKRDICLFALVDVGGDVEFVTTEDVAVRAFELYPERFGLVKYRQFPDVDSVRVTLSDLSKPKYESLVEGGQKSGWRATKRGATWERVHRNAVMGAMKHKLSGERRISSGHLMTTEKIRSSRLNRIVRSEAFAKWKKGARPSVYDFYDLLR